MLLGCLVGFVPPTAVVHYRSIVTAHLEFVSNGVLQAGVEVTASASSCAARLAASCAAPPWGAPRS